MYKVKEFWRDIGDEESIIHQVNEWLAKNKDKIEPISISKNLTINNPLASETLTILYKEI